MNVKISGLLFGPVKYLLLMSILLLSCSKIIHKESEYSGTVINKVTGDPYEGARLLLFERDFLFLRDGTSGGSKDAVEGVYSDANGLFSISYDTKEAWKYTYSLEVINVNYAFVDIIYQGDVHAPDFNITKKNEDKTDINIEVIPEGNISIFLSRLLNNTELISFALTSSYSSISDRLNFDSTTLNEYSGIGVIMGTYSINYKYDSDGDTTNWDWEKTDTFWVEEGQTTEFVIDVDG